MAKRNYTKYTKPAEPKEETTEQIEVTTEDSIENITQNEAVEEWPNPIGFVNGCSRLNVRKGPSTGSEIVCTVDSGAELTINSKESTDDFYKISTVAGIEGFCMKKFITIR